MNFVYSISWTLSTRYPAIVPKIPWTVSTRYPDMHLRKRLTYPVECRWIDACARSNCSGCFEIWIRFPPFVRSYHRPPRRRFLLPLFFFYVCFCVVWIFQNPNPIALFLLLHFVVSCRPPKYLPSCLAPHGCSLVGAVRRTSQNISQSTIATW